MHVVAALCGFAVLIGTTSSLIRTLVMPRGLRSKTAEAVQLCVLLPLRLVARRLTDFERKDRVLAYAGPVAVLAILLSWLAGYLIGYSLLLFAWSRLGLLTSFREAGSSLFTLGFASSDRSRLTAIDFAAAASGPVSIGLLIGYLPALYGAYARRETEVTLLQARAGIPAWGPEILARHAQVDLLGTLDGLFDGWERWCADISESHTSYPALIYFRSPRVGRDWLIGLLAVMDAAALHLALNPSMASRQARLTLRAGFVCLRDIAQVEGVRFDADPSPDSPIDLSYDEYLGGISRMRERDYPMERTPEAAWPDFRGWRVNYEAVAYALARRIEAVPAPWSGPRRGRVAPMPVISPIDRRPTAPT